MNIDCRRERAIDTLRISLLESPLGALEAIDELLSRPALKAAVVLIEDTSSSCDDSILEDSRRNAADRIAARLRRATVPTAGVVSPSASEPARCIARACHFAFASADQAMARLDSMTADRPPHLIHAVMTSINNQSRMPLEEALLEETRLFCAVSSRKRHPRGRSRS
jgi:enoyl-CoA hydratase/carnithine racemase